MGVYVFNWKTLKEYLERDASNPDSHNDFGNTQCPGKNLKPHVSAFRSLR